MSGRRKSAISGSAFDFKPCTRILFGVDSISRVGSLAKELGMRRALLVTDRGIVSAGHSGRVEKSLLDAGISATTFHDVVENPTTDSVEACLRLARAEKIDGIIGLGGGSSMDTAKGCNFLLTNGGRMQDYWGVGKASKAMLPMIAIPTTSGTGSECQSFALISDPVTHQKMACGDQKALPRIALLDPSLTLSQPPRVTACTGIDAIAHAVESFVTAKRTPLSMMYAREAFRLCVSSLPIVLKRGDDMEARGNMLLGAAFAGTAIENSMLGAAHAAANPLTAHYGIVHGMAVGMMLPHVVEFNAGTPAAKKSYIELANLVDRSPGKVATVKMLVEELKRIGRLAGFPNNLKACGVEKSMIGKLAEEAAQQWTATFNPRPIAAADFKKVYLKAFSLERDSIG